MTTHDEGYLDTCCVEDCGITYFLPWEGIPELARTRGLIVCPCGHKQHMTNSGAAKAIRALYEYKEYKRQLGTPTLEDSDREAKLNAKIKDIDDFLARRGKYAP